MDGVNRQLLEKKKQKKLCLIPISREFVVSHRERKKKAKAQCQKRDWLGYHVPSLLFNYINIFFFSFFLFSPPQSSTFLSNPPILVSGFSFGLRLAS